MALWSNELLLHLVFQEGRGDCTVYLAYDALLTQKGLQQRGQALQKSVFVLVPLAFKGVEDLVRAAILLCSDDFEECRGTNAKFNLGGLYHEVREYRFALEVIDCSHEETQLVMDLDEHLYQLYKGKQKHLMFIPIPL